MKWRLWTLLIAGQGLLACAPTTQVTLLPQDEAQQTAVAVQSQNSRLELNQPYATARQRGQRDLQAGLSSAEQVQARHQSLLAASPAPAQSRVLYFEAGGTRFTPESEARIDEALAHALESQGADIVVIGHTDRTGTDELNDRLSLQRANIVRELLILRGFDPRRIEAVGRGSRQPLVAHPPDGNEPRNRRTEIIVR